MTTPSPVRAPSLPGTAIATFAAGAALFAIGLFQWVESYKVSATWWTGSNNPGAGSPIRNGGTTWQPYAEGLWRGIASPYDGPPLALIAVPLFLFACFLIIRSEQIYADPAHTKTLPDDLYRSWYFDRLRGSAYRRGFLVAAVAGSGLFIAIVQTPNTPLTFGKFPHIAGVIGLVLACWLVWRGAAYRIDEILFRGPQITAAPRRADDSGKALPADLTSVSFGMTWLVTLIAFVIPLLASFMGSFLGGQPHSMTHNMPPLSYGLGWLWIPFLLGYGLVAWLGFGRRFGTTANAERILWEAFQRNKNPVSGITPRNPAAPTAQPDTIDASKL